ncbi:MAG: T9SS type A sorting domain-containing protein [Chlorobi bacterium]|nr:T9SS type A sorting domain-containing protein [Chlorobiota bacterium]
MSVLFLFIFYSITLPQTLFRSGIFLHHSTGACIWGPNGSDTSIPDEINNYNSTNGLTGDEAISMDEEEFPLDPWINEWYRWHNIFNGNDPTADIEPYYNSDRIIVIKSCFPSSELQSWGSPSDTLDPEYKSVYNYKWHWRSFISVMKNHPDNFFAVWTNAPLVPNSTNDSQAQLSDKFCKWAKDTLALGLDPILGEFPPNVYVFDFFHKLAGPDGKLQLQYAQDEWDSHPNSAATELVAPQFVEEIFDAAIAYESVTPVELISFDYSLNNNSVELRWQTATETNNKGFELQRSNNKYFDNLSVLAFIDGKGTTSETQNYSFADKNISAGKYFYRLKQIDNDGSFHYSKILEAEILTPEIFELMQNYPNPFGKGSLSKNNSTSISFDLPFESNVSLIVYNALGEKVSDLFNGKLQAGFHSVNFNSEKFPSGVYFYELITPKFSKTKKMLLIQ